MLDFLRTLMGQATIRYLFFFLNVGNEMRYLDPAQIVNKLVEGIMSNRLIENGGKMHNIDEIEEAMRRLNESLTLEQP